MKKRNMILIILLTLSLMFTSFAVSLAADPSGLIVVRATDNSLWKATCVGLTCTAFSSIPGQFTSQPTIYWDVNIQSYVLWGRGLDGAIWRSTFAFSGAFNNNWAIPIAGSTASPPGAAGGGLFNSSFFINPVHGSVAVTAPTISNIKSDYCYCPWDGFVLATSTGDIGFSRASTSGSSWIRIFLSETSGGTATTWTAAELPDGSPAGSTYMPYAITRSVSCLTSGGNKYVYLTAEEGGSASGTTTTTIWDSSLHFQYVPFVW